MRLRGLLVAAAVLAALGGAIYWSNRAKKAEEAKPSKDAPPQILSLTADQIQQIEVRRAGAEPVILRRQDAGPWAMTTPPQFPVDQDAAGGMVSTLSSLSADRLVEEKASDLAPFGLDRPSLEVAVTMKDGKSHRLFFGEETPTGSGWFAKLDGEEKVYTVASYNKSSLEKTPRELRDKRLLTFSSDTLTRVELTAKGQTIEFGKDAQGQWQIIRPQPLRADGGHVEELIRKLSGARMDASITEDDEKRATSAFTGAALVGVARVTDASGTQQLEIRRDKQQNYYARSSVVAGAHKVFSDLGEALDKPLDDFRNKKLFDFGWSDPSKIEIRDGSKQTVYQKSGDKWMEGSRQVDASSINAVIDKLRDLSATRFVTSGFAAPVFEAAVTSNEGKRVERVSISRQGTVCLAKREGEPSVYEIDAKTLEELQKAAAEVKEHQEPKAEKKK